MDEAGDWRDLVRVQPGGRLEVRNPTSTERHVKLERTARVRDAASAGEVTALPGFRRQFGADVLRTGLSVSAGRLAFLFSDLVGSTALYGEIGDAAAFRLVQEHFDALLPILGRHGGSLVKTIGDAVMAVFTDDRAAVRAGLEMLREFEDFRARSATHALTHLKLGVHSGPAYAVRANDTLDYFGQTVNVAARVQGEAGPGELVTDDRTVRELLKSGGLDGIDVGAPYAARLKGVSGTLSLIRLTLDASPHPSLRRA
jgi:class 3 adenylate cyclase